MQIWIYCYIFLCHLYMYTQVIFSATSEKLGHKSWTDWWLSHAADMQINESKYKIRHANPSRHLSSIFMYMSMYLCDRWSSTLDRNGVEKWLEHNATDAVATVAGIKHHGTIHPSWRGGCWFLSVILPPPIFAADRVNYAIVFVVKSQWHAQLL